ncbi:Uncharacterized protein HZ326_24260 [Fusarium oxysporum f. sp. albedinis]|nr:Uncharacterized protein HZ326_24260 [Fusarium oxysporum f. sp. albedinis]
MDPPYLGGPWISLSTNFYPTLSSPSLPYNKVRPIVAPSWPGFSNNVTGSSKSVDSTDYNTQTPNQKAMVT